MSSQTPAVASERPPVVTSPSELRERLAAVRRAGKTIGLVPTMGALHAGHISLVDASRREADFTVVTIFVNPTQFGPKEDFARYPRTLESDLRALQGHGVGLVFAPATEEMYRPGHVTSVEVSGPALPFEGRCRPGHFRGVATIVLKLFNLIPADFAYFGRKDYQQALVVRQMVEDFDVPIQIRVCPIVREPDGLALSSRNVYLSDEERQRALALSRSLRLARQLVEHGTRDAETILQQMRNQLEQAQVDLDYVVLADPETLEEVARVDRPTVALIAGRVGTTRLIDNEVIVPG